MTAFHNHSIILFVEYILCCNIGNSESLNIEVAEQKNSFEEKASFSVVLVSESVRILFTSSERMNHCVHIKLSEWERTINFDQISFLEWEERDN